MFANALARTEVMPVGWATSNIGEDDSDSSLDASKKALDKTGTLENRDENKRQPHSVKKTWASFFVGNNQRSEGTTLQKVEVGKGAIKLLVEDVETAVIPKQRFVLGLGIPYAWTKITASCERVSYARALVEVDVANEMVKCIEVELPSGEIHLQAVYYENLPKFCSNCKRQDAGLPGKGISGQVSQVAGPSVQGTEKDQAIEQIARKELRTKVQQVQVQSQEEIPEIQAQVIKSTPDLDQNCTRVRGEMDHNQQNQKVQIIRLAAAQKKGTNQSGRRLTTGCTENKILDKSQASSTSHGQQGAKGEEGKKKIEKKKMERNGNAAHNTDFYVDMGRAMVNTKWLQEGLPALANLGLPGRCSDHAPCVVDTWSLHVEGTAMFKLCKKLKALKNPLRTSNRRHFPHISARAVVAEEKLLEGQQLLHDNPRDESLKNRVAELRKKASRLAEAEVSFCSQLAKAKYLKNCDKGTKFFHDLIKRNTSRNQIVALIDASGSATTSPQQVSSLFVEYYKNLLGTRKVCSRLDKEIFLVGNLVSEDQASDLIRPVLDEEIKAALFDIASRLSPILEKLIDPAQSAFVTNRSMVENIYMVQELLRKYSWKIISPRCIMKVDHRKAYETVNWEVLEDALVGLRNLGRLSRNPQFNHHPKCSEMSITHLAFADDLILFTKRDVTSVRLRMECLRNFGDCSGLCINASKSNVYMAGISPQEMEEIKLITGFSIGKFPFRYLGIPVASSRLTIEQFNPLILKVSDYISAWAGASLSYADLKEGSRAGQKWSKHAFMLWLSLKERLLTRDKLWDNIEDTSEMNTIKAAVKWTMKEAQGTGENLPNLPVLYETSRCRLIHLFMASFQTSRTCDGGCFGDGDIRWMGLLAAALDPDCCLCSSLPVGVLAVTVVNPPGRGYVLFSRALSCLLVWLCGMLQFSQTSKLNGGWLSVEAFWMLRAPLLGALPSIACA
ncbi:hypothetical protein Acr_13g0009990 [Actinidia rufa]|uniref:Reverse transcriptase domain-containing protein n=1 Tax=Actinidia rufa TaxID=165716 RepID=A0A7J0FN80_9ERIC|nr:hypothetical protein Acr_13g0009990 [Actinidia rufa]